MANETTIAGPEPDDVNVTGAGVTTANATSPSAAPESFAMIASSYDTVFAELRSRQVAALALFKTRLFAPLRDANIDTVKVTFEGSGDSGQIEDIIAYRGDDVFEIPAETLTWPFVTMEAKYVPCDSNPNGQSFAGYEVKDSQKTATITDIIEDIFWNFIGQTHGGWENNDGGFGECHFIVEDEIIRLEMNVRYTETDYSEHNW